MGDQQSGAQLESLPKLTGPERVAAVLLALQPEQAQGLLKYFDPEDVKTIGRSLFTLQSLAPSDLSDLIDEFVSSFKEGVGVVSSREQAEHMLAGVLTDEQILECFAGEVVDETPETIDWDKFSEIEVNELGEFLSGEHPQVVAFVLKKLGPEVAAKILSGLSDVVSQDIVSRLLSNLDVEISSERAIWQVISDNFEEGDRNYLDEIVGILNGLEKLQVEMLLDELEKTNEREVKILRASLFAFEDLISLTAKECSIIFEQVSMEQIILALSACDEAFQRQVLSAVGGRSRRMIDAELSTVGDPDPAAVKDAQRAVADTALKLFASGQINRPEVE